MSQGHETRRYYSFRDSIKLLVGIITALAVENALAQLSLQTGNPNNTTRSLHDVPGSVWLAFFSSITLTLRFFFGNIQYLNSDPDNDTIELLIDTSTILIQSMILALITNYINNDVQFFLSVIGLFIFDFVWFVLFNIQAHMRGKSKLQSSMGYGQANALTSIVLLIVFGFNYPVSLLDHGLSDFLKQVDLNEGRTLAMMILNLGLDLWINGRRYLDI